MFQLAGDLGFSHEPAHRLVVVNLLKLLEHDLPAQPGVLGHEDLPQASLGQEAGDRVGVLLPVAGRFPQDTVVFARIDRHVRIGRFPVDRHVRLGRFPVDRHVRLGGLPVLRQVCRE